MFAVVIVLVTAALMVVGTIFRGWVLSILWSWFITPVFTSLPDLALVPAIGLSLVVTYLMHQHDAKSKNEDETKSELGSSIALVLIFPFLFLGLGYVVHLFM